ncbi:liprin-beta-1-like isoform X3 [Physella acuta]|uniref:liprin-beta-1-like isoform X3 n=1 Tax=Physella acuta TaxID=109671 RepID=UPI0027DDB46A|nr:liprin-beta-1-like isoform X3 [Physella acuta]
MNNRRYDRYGQYWGYTQEHWGTIPGARVNVRSEPGDSRLRRLEEDKQSLSLQVSVLSEQVDAQAEKIRDMDMCIEEYRQRMIEANDVIQQELLTRSSLEHHKLDLMAEVSHLKMRLSSAEKDRRELDDRFRAVQRQVTELEAKLLMKDAENSELRLRLGRNGTLPLDSSDTEVEKLKRAIDTLMLANEEKERKLEDMRRLLKRYRRVEEILVQAQGRKAVEELLMNIEDGDTSSNSSSTTPSVGETAIRDQPYPMFHPDDRPDKHYLSSPSATSTPMHQLNTSFNGGNAVSSIPVNSRQAMGMTRSNSCEHLVPGSKPKTPSFRKKDEQSPVGGPPPGSGGYGTLPKQRSKEDVREGKRSRGFHSLGKTLLRVRSGKRSSSAPNLAHTEVVTDDEDGLQHYGHDPREYKKKRGLLRLFGKLKRSSSQDFEGSRERAPDGEFKRGGVRATASARLAWNRDMKGRINSEVPFARWDTDRVTAWMNDIGLNLYLVDCKRWVKNGEQLLRCSQHDLEKELGMKNGLHRKKLQLAMQAMATENIDKFMELDYNFVARWLDDIGLPQYKDSFYDARVDGRMLNYLTVEDLFALKVFNEVHHVSIKRAIQILRLNNFNPNCLRRRPAPDEPHQMKGIPGEVVLWTNHRVMEWLRTIDLSEYAPNLRGSGVHGALMVLEPRFNSELFAVLLSIPPSKTLLRRHLNTHFISLIGPETQTRKREHESQPGYVPLQPNNKVKKGKFALFSHKRTKSETEADGFICPLELNGQYSNGKRDEKAAKEIGAYSQEINSLTNMLSHERFLDSAKTSNV